MRYRVGDGEEEMGRRPGGGDRKEEMGGDGEEEMGGDRRK